MRVKKSGWHNLRGFIGPLGDDIPSIFPIVAGTLLFISALVYANGQMHDRDNYLKLKKSALELSYAAMDKGFITPGTFTAKCENSVKPIGRKNGVRFAVMLKDCAALDADAANSDPFRGAPICTMETLTGPGNPPAFADADKPKDFVALSYPVSTTCAGGDGLGMINIITWYK